MYLITVKFVQGATTVEHQEMIEAQMSDALAAVSGGKSPRETRYVLQAVESAPRRRTPDRNVVHLDFTTWHARIAGTAREAA